VNRDTHRVQNLCETSRNHRQLQVGDQFRQSEWDPSLFGFSDFSRLNRGIPTVLAISLAIGIGNIFDPSLFLKSVGPYALIAVVVIVFIETGLLFPFLPGDSLVFAAAIVVARIGVPLWLLMVVVAVTASAGSQLAFLIGRRSGPRLFTPSAKIFKTKYRDQADVFFTRYGSLALILARFVPVVRTYISPIVGASQMRARRFFVGNVVGAMVWSVVLCLAGYFLGKIPAIAHNIDLIAVAIVVISVLPIAIGYLRNRIRARGRRTGTSTTTS
jgi:membrane-associated protein